MKEHERVYYLSEDLIKDGCTIKRYYYDFIGYCLNPRPSNIIGLQCIKADNKVLNNIMRIFLGNDRNTKSIILEDIDGIKSTYYLYLLPDEELYSFKRSNMFLFNSLDKYVYVFNVDYTHMSYFITDELVPDIILEDIMTRVCVQNVSIFKSMSNSIYLKLVKEIKK